jgi:4-hydroxy-tetrahydrodipicolinate synthase
MQNLHSIPRGLWLPLITPFRDGKLDVASVRRLIAHYTAEPIDGMILAGNHGRRPDAG